MSDCSIGAVGILGHDKQLVGIFTERDLAWVVAQRRDPSEVKLSEVVNDFPVIVEGPLSDEAALDCMRKAHIRHLLIDEGGDVRIVSMRDLVSIPPADSPQDRGPRGDEEQAGWPYGVSFPEDTLKV
jgi:CBS domain-containing protein